MFCVLSGVLCANERDKLPDYVYEDTKQLVTLVEDAAALIEHKGAAAFADFEVKGSRWFNDKYYLFIYDLACKCVFHPVEPGLVGQDLSSFKDIARRPVITLIADIGKKPQPNASGWVFYLWEDPWHSLPRWKSSYIRKAIAPDGMIYLVGSGSSNMKMEKAFIQERVDMAVDLILAKGRDAAFSELNDGSCPLHILNSYIMVVDKNGDIVVDPAFPALGRKRNVLDFHDKTGRYIAREILKGLNKTDRIWTFFIWPKGDVNRLTRHLMYVHKVKVGGEVFYVAAYFAPVTPVWMKQ